MYQYKFRKHPVSGYVVRDGISGSEFHAETLESVYELYPESRYVPDELEFQLDIARIHRKRYNRGGNGSGGTPCQQQ